ncbi:hypothetical protein ACGFYT_14500 [Streptomyces sp. NPDC048208]|uniref:hypothetical protein n=1 Tax=Streptomyces sp. NPDC048208 TaxID=3365515 RepID=UPI00370FAA29
MLRASPSGTRLGRSQALTTYFLFLELLHKVEIHRMTGRVIECPIDEMNRPRGAHGHQRRDQLVALRSLCTWAKRQGVIFRNPTSRIKVGQNEYAVLQPLLLDQVERSVAAAMTPAVRLVLALAAVHAARVAQIAALMLDGVDPGNRRLTIAGRARPLDDLTLKLLTGWPGNRRRRWPSTANLYLLINNQTANTTGRAGNHWISAPLRGQDASLERLRVDRQLEEALTHGSTGRQHEGNHG